MSVVVPLGSCEVRNTDADVVDESGPGHLLLLSTPAQRIAAPLAGLPPQLVSRGR